MLIPHYMRRHVRSWLRLSQPKIVCAGQRVYKIGLTRNCRKQLHRECRNGERANGSLIYASTVPAMRYLGGIGLAMNRIYGEGGGSSANLPRILTAIVTHFEDRAESIHEAPRLDAYSIWFQYGRCLGVGKELHPIVAPEAICELQDLHLPSTFMHGDMHYKNAIVTPSGEPYFLDWEYGGYGSVLFDLWELMHSSIRAQHQYGLRKQVVAHLCSRVQAIVLNSEVSAESLERFGALMRLTRMCHARKLRGLAARKDDARYIAAVNGQGRTIVGDVLS